MRPSCIPQSRVQFHPSDSFPPSHYNYQPGTAKADTCFSCEELTKHFLTRFEESATHPLPHARARRRPWWATVGATDSGGQSSSERFSVATLRWFWPEQVQNLCDLSIILPQHRLHEHPQGLDVNPGDEGFTEVHFQPSHQRSLQTPGTVLTDLKLGVGIHLTLQYASQYRRYDSIYRDYIAICWSYFKQ